MPAPTNVATQIMGYRNLLTGAGIQPIKRLPEQATQTFLQGTPVQLNAGYVRACAPIVSAATALIAGFSVEAGANLATSGVPQTQNLTNKVPNQPNAVITPIGAPPNDGTTGFLQVADVQTFIGTLSNGSTGTHTLVAADIGSIFGLTQDAGNQFWYLDANITTTAAGACVEVVGLVDPIGTVNGRVEFKVTKAAQQLLV
jgi:hypothetical protein